MRKYVSGFLFFFCLTAGSLIALFLLTRDEARDEAQTVQATESLEQPAFAGSEPETETMVHLVLNQDRVISETEDENYCLVAEEGYLIVYNRDRITVNLFTHMPLAEFPASEQERLMAGIWFPTMSEIFSYLESYSS